MQQLLKCIVDCNVSNSQVNGMDRIEEYVTCLLRDAFNQEHPSIARISLALGNIEDALINPSLNESLKSLSNLVDEQFAVLKRQAGQLDSQLQANSSSGVPMSAREVIRHITEYVWSFLSGTFQKDALHVQHISSFVRYVSQKQQLTRRQLCCGGVTTTVFSLVQLLAYEFGYDMLRDVCMGITEDHCLLFVDKRAERESSVEVTSEAKEKRGKEADEVHWAGWLYCGGHPVICSEAQAIVACLVSINYSIKKGIKAKEVVEDLFDFQLHMLHYVWDNYPDAMYPAAISKLATMMEESYWSDMDLECTKTADAIHDQYLSWNSHVQQLHSTAISLAAQLDPDGTGFQWYVYSSLITSEFYSIELYMYFIRHSMETTLGTNHDREQNCVGQNHQSAARSPWYGKMLASFDRVMSTCIKGCRVLVKYKHHSHDEELYKDIEDILEKLHTAFNCVFKNVQHEEPLMQQDAFIKLLTFWDAICVYFSEKSKPSKWIKQVIRMAKLIHEPHRVEALTSSNVCFLSRLMTESLPHWKKLSTNAVLCSIFEASETTSSHTGQRRRPVQGDNIKRRRMNA